MRDPRIDHIGIATENLDDHDELWKLLGFQHGGDEINEEQGVRIRFYQSADNSEGQARIELLEPIDESSPIHQFIQTRGVGIQQLAIEVEDIDSTLAELISAGFIVINNSSFEGANQSKIAFLHPSSTGGVLVELVQHS